MCGNDIIKEINYPSWFSLPGIFFYKNSNETETFPCFNNQFMFHNFVITFCFAVVVSNS